MRSSSAPLLQRAPVLPDLDPLSRGLTTPDLEEAVSLIEAGKFKRVEVNIGDRSLSFDVKYIDGRAVADIIRVLVPRHRTPMCSLALDNGSLSFGFEFMEVDDLSAFFHAEVANLISKNPDLDLEDDFDVSLSDFDVLSDKADVEQAYSDVFSEIVSILEHYPDNVVSSDILLHFICVHLEHVLLDSEDKSLREDIKNHQSFYTFHRNKISAMLGRMQFLKRRQKILRGSSERIAKAIRSRNIVMPSFGRSVSSAISKFTTYSKSLAEASYFEFASDKPRDYRK